MASQSVESHVMLEDVGLLARFFRGAKWYGAEWYITVFGGVILVLILLMTILAPHLAPYDPVKSVGSPFTAPGEGRQVLIVRTGEESIQGPGDLDGVLFVPGQRAEELLETARSIQQTEREQAKAVQAGRTLREQLHFDEYLTRRAADPSYTFRKHLRAVGGAIEE